MYTQCPECRTIFRVHEDQLAAAGGRVRCGQCMHVFKAPDHQVDRLPGGTGEGAEEAVDAATGFDAEGGSADLAAEGAVPNPAEAADETGPPEEPAGFASERQAPPTEPESPPEPEPPAEPATTSAGPLEEELDESRIETLLSGDEPPAPEPEGPPPEPGPAPEPGGPDAPTAAEDAEPAVAPAPPREPAPEPPRAQDHLIDELRGASGTRSRTGATVVWSLLILVLVAGLLGQYGYMNRNELAREPVLRPWLERLCRLADCEVPPRRDLTAIEVFDPQIQSHPRFRDALLISATLTNGADFAQPYPVVEVILKDLGGNRVAWRRFAPADYLVQSDHARFPAGSEAHLLLEVTDPGDEAVGFEFNIVDAARR
ncbi:MAG TPA: DUF3426 domain-containing protein [Gammaproteobacteria bacterium]|nr:DUF3426 domain-containing protein [Gammaproteobacteria bacterium]